MESYLPALPPIYIALTIFIAMLSGFVKGVVGFAMPLVLISGLTTFISPELALAGLILPTLVTNIMQSLRQGSCAAIGSVRKFKVFLISGGITLVLAAQLVRVIPDQTLTLVIGSSVVFFVALQLSGYQFSLARQSVGIEAAVGAIAGGLGGLSGIWGAPTVAYLTALGTEKHDQMRIQGVIYGLGALALLGAHIGSGVLRGYTWAFSAALIPPAVLGMWLGGKVMDRIDQSAFRQATLFVLLIAGLNLLRRGLL